jgi:hypothetical protein
MHGTGLVGGHQLYHGLLAACQAAGQWELALEVFLGLQVRAPAADAAVASGAGAAAAAARMSVGLVGVRQAQVSPCAAAVALTNCIGDTRCLSFQ